MAIILKFLFQVFFPNAKEGDFQFVTMPNLLIRIHPDGQILYILRWDNPLHSHIYDNPCIDTNTRANNQVLAYLKVEFLIHDRVE